jgi:hypothetical protein
MRTTKPDRHRLRHRIDDGDLAGRRMQVAHRHDCGGAVGQRRLERAGGGAECGQRLVGPEHVDQRVPNHPACWRGGGNGAGAIGDEHGAAAATFERHRDDILGVAPLPLRTRRLAVQSAREVIREQFDLIDRTDRRFTVMVENLHTGADRHREEKRDDQERHRPPQRRFGDEQPVVGRVGQRLRQPLDRIRIGRRARNVSRRHRVPPKTCGEGCPQSPPNQSV